MGRAKRTVSAELKNKNKYSYGLIEAVGFQFPRLGVYLEQGVFGGLYKKEAIARGKLRPQPWFNPVMEKRLPVLSEKIAKLNGDLVLNAIKLKI